MADVLYFNRDTKVYVQLTASPSNWWEVPVLDGFSFSQSTNSSEITLQEMESSAGTSRRGRKMFNDSLAPVEWSFSTYVRPFQANPSFGTGAANNQNDIHAVEEILWALFNGPATYGTPATYDFPGFTRNASSLAIDFSTANKSSLGTANIYFAMNSSTAQIYKLTKAVVNEATIDFDIDGIATIQWSGFAQFVEGTGVSLPSGNPISEGKDDTEAFIRNRLAQLSITAASANQAIFNGAGGSSSPNGVYNLTLTGGSITMTNNMTYLVPEELGIVNIPLNHVTGNRSISGSFNCYLNLDDSSNLGTSTDFYGDMVSAAARQLTVNSFDTTLKIGGTTASTPRLHIQMPQAHFEIPSHSIEDVIGLETNFHALPSKIGLTDEATLTYFRA